MNKRTWQTPSLIIVVKGTLEEAVLTVCKAEPFGVTTATPQAAAPGCFVEPCTLCSTLTNT